MITANLPAAPSAHPEQSKAAFALAFGILGIALMGIFAPVAWVIGTRELSAIDAGRRPPTNRGIAVAARLLGVVGSVILLGAALLFVLALVGIIPVS